MVKPDPMSLATRVFDTPLLLAPAKAAVIAEGLGARLLGLGTGAEISVTGSHDTPGDHHRTPHAASLLGDEVHHSLRKRGGGYSVIGGVAVIPVTGSLVRRGAYLGESSGVTSYEGLSAQIRTAGSDPEVTALALEIDSFGGEAAGMFELAADIRAVRAQKPVHAFLADNALSAGYGIASAADRIVIPEFGSAGSIGVMCMHADVSRQLDQSGVKITLIHAGAKKVEGHPFAPLPEDLRASMQQDMELMWQRFAQAVAEGRKGRVSAESILRLEAGVFRGEEAVRLGLADEVSDARTAFTDLVSRGRAAAQGAVQGTALSHSQQAGSDLAPPVAAVAAAAPASFGAGAQVPAQFGGNGPHVHGGHASRIQESMMANAPTTQDGQTTHAPPAASNTAPDAAADAVRAERERASKISAKVAAAGLSASFAQSLIDNDVPLADAYEQILDKKAETASDGGDIRNTGPVSSIVADGRDRVRAGVTAGLLQRVNMQGGEHNEFTGMTLREMARTVLSAQGGSVPRGGVQALASAAFMPASAGAMHTTSDFGNILADVANKAMLKGFEESPEIIDRFTSVGTMTDFKPTKRVGLDAFPNLDKVAEGAEFKYGTMGDHAETAILATYGKLFAITRQTIINDDLDAFTKVPAKMGRAARRTVADLVFAVLTKNARMSDGKALFHADHGNLAQVAGLPSEATLNAAITAMAEQTERGGHAKLNIPAKFLLAPPKYRSAALRTLNSEYTPDETGKTGGAAMPAAYNTVRNAAEPLFDARLGDAWFMLADAGLYDVIEIGYLDGINAPFMDQQDGWSVDGTEFKVRIDATATALAWQGMYMNAGK